MPPLETNEKIVYTCRKHWFILAGEAFFLLLLAVAPGFFLFAPDFVPAGLLHTLNEFTRFEGNFMLSVLFLWTIELLVLYIIFFLLWTDYYLDVWLVTNIRVIAIEQHGLFNRSISTFRLDMIQDATVYVPGILATILRFGKIEVSTASDDSFVFKGAAHPNILKGKIMEEHHRVQLEKQEVSIKQETSQTTPRDSE